jgi:hypothetical protein
MTVWGYLRGLIQCETEPGPMTAFHAMEEELQPVSG